MITDRDHIIPAFHFRVLFKGLDIDGDDDSGFQSISGLKISTTIPARSETSEEVIKETTLFNPVVLRRAIRSTHRSPLREWVLRCLNHSSRETLPEMIIEILNEEHEPHFAIRCTHVTAWGWELSELNASNSELLMEEISLQYKSIDMKNVS
jgi:phage tail-like protein